MQIGWSPRSFAAQAALVLFATANFWAIMSAVLALSTLLPPRWANPILATAAGFGLWAAFLRMTRSERILGAFGIEILEQRMGLGPLSWTRYKPGRVTGPCSIQPARAPALLLLIVLAASGVVLGGVHAHWHGRFEALRREFSAKGYPLSLARFEEDLPQQSYAYPHWQRVRNPLRDRTLTSLSLSWKNKTSAWTPAMYRKASAQTPAREAFLEKEIAPLLGARYARFAKIDYVAAARKASFELPEYDGLLRAGSLFQEAAGWRAYQGDTARAWRKVEGAVELAELVSHERQMLGRSVHLGLRKSVAASALLVMLNRPGSSIPPALERRFESFLMDHIVAEGSKAELAGFLDFMARFDDVHRPLEDTNPPGGIFETTGVRLIKIMFRSMGLIDLNRLAGASYISRFARPLTAMEAEAEMEASRRERKRYPFWPYFLLPGSAWAPNLATMHRLEWEAKTWLRLALVVSAASRYRQRSAHWPERLGQLAPIYVAATILEDPYTSRPFEYDVGMGGRSFRLCSNGPKGDRMGSRGDELCVSMGR